MGRLGTAGSDSQKRRFRATLLTTNTHLRFAKSDAYGFGLVSIDASRAEVTFVRMGDPRTKSFSGPLSRTRFVTPAGTNRIIAA